MFKKKAKANGAARRRVLVDTSTLIDGRILAVAKTGFIGDELVISRSVLGELQLLADGGDGEKRARARFGLDVIRELQAIKGQVVTVWEDEREAHEGVDARLIDLAKRYGMMLMTNDFNLNKVASVEGMRVLNINDLAQGLRSTYLPGDKLVLELTQKGSEPNQAVGHLSDGTMVVVENAASETGKKVEVEFIRYLQTSAGKMMFAKMTARKVGSEMEGARLDAGRKDDRRQRPEKNDGERYHKPRREDTRKIFQPRQGGDANRDRRRNSRRRESSEDRLVRLANE